MSTERLTVAMIAELTKCKLSLVVAFSTVTGYLIFDGGSAGGLWPVAAGVFLLSAGAAALNQYTKRISDAVMARTAGRPLPSGRMTSATAASVAIILLVSGSLLLGFSGLVPFLLGLANVLLYNFIYTGLKKVTALAIIPGALVGAVPP
jgi:protoheme IX farnesyltransferase